MKRAFTFIALVWFIAVVAVVATGCQKKATDSGGLAVNESVVDVSAPSGGYAAQPPVAQQPVVYDTEVPATPEPGMTDLSGAGSYTVKKGDTLYGIARQRYGDGKQWTRIADANPGLRPETLKAGQTISLP